MGFLRQMSLLLWKNFTLKKRTPFVLLFELFIPLVLFVIVISIRKRQPPVPRNTYRWGPQPLPSSGAIPIMQLFCEKHDKHVNGSDHRYHFSNSSDFLNRLQRVGEQHHFFYPGYTPTEMEQLPAIYRNIIDGPATLQQSFIHAQNVRLDSVIQTSDNLKDFLRNNISMPDEEVDNILHSTVNLKEVYRLIFGSYPEAHNHTRIRRSLGKYIPDLHQMADSLLSPSAVPDINGNQSNLLTTILSDISSEFQQGAIRSLMADRELWEDRNIVTFLLYFLNETGGIELPKSLSAREIAEMLKFVFLSPEVIRQGACDPREFSLLLVPPSPNNFSDLNSAQELLCNMTDAQAQALSDILKADIPVDRVVQVLHLQDTNVASFYSELEDFLSNMGKFYKFQTTLYELSVLVETLPQDGCDLMAEINATTPSTHPTGDKSGASPEDDEKAKKKNKFAGLLKFWDGMQQTICGHSAPNRHNEPVTSSQPSTETTIKPDRQTGTSSNIHKNSETQANVNHTTESSRTQIDSMANSTNKQSESDEHTSHTTKPVQQQQTGSTRPSDARDIHPEVHIHHRKRRSANEIDDFEDFNFDELGLSWGQTKNLKILIHVLYSNPKVLYAPNNTAANSIIKKANETFQLVDMVNKYAREWLNVSSDLRSYLKQNSTRYNLEAIRLIQSDLRDKTSYLSVLTLDERVSRFVNLQIPDVSFFLHEIDSIDNAACTWLSLMSGINLNVFKGFESEADLVDFFLNKQYFQNVSVVAGVVFENVKSNKSLPTHIRYKIRQNATFTPTTKRVRDKYWYPGPGSGQYPYYQFGFLFIQDIIERAIINVQVGHDVVEPGSYIRRFPYHCWLYDKFLFMIEHVMPLCLTISWVYSVAMLVQSIVYEKEQRLKEVMKMMGLSNAVHWLAWFITTFIQFTVSMAVLTAMLKYGKILSHSNTLIVFTTLEVFGIATISFCFLVSTLYSKAKVAAACAGIVYFLTYVPYMYVAIKEDVAGDSISSVVKTLVSLFSTTAFGLGGKYFAFYEEAGVGVQWNNIYISPVEDDQFNLLMVIMMMIFDTFLYGLMAWYIENVFPGSYGLPKPWYFPFTRTYWCGGHAKLHDHECGCMFDACRRGHGFHIMEEDQAGAMSMDPEHASKFEAEPSHLKLGVSIDHLTKIYKTGRKLAVRNLSLRLYENQITSFLGHNGAGKTTTMSILTGFFPPTSGSATIYGHDIRTDMEVIRQGLGMCPQHNVLFDKLTVEEHLWFYARLKGMKATDIDSEMDIMIDDLGLPKKRKSRVDCLSGGMQRKLSVAIAFVGGSQTVILDEPTAGVDPYARRAIWDLLIKYKSGRTILLSTHHMDEADLLGDRIAIISSGEMKCCGSSLFLKNTFCEGYHLYLVKQEVEEDIRSTDDAESHDHSQHAFVTKCQSSEVTGFIQKYVSTAYLKKDTRRELHYILPYEEAKKGNFEKLFQALESGQHQLYISSYGVADSTLEEVFLEVTENSIRDAADKEDEEKTLESMESQPRDEQASPFSTPLAELLDEAAGGQSEPTSPAAANKIAGNELQMGDIKEGIANPDGLELGNIRKGTAKPNGLELSNSREDTANRDGLELGDIKEGTANPDGLELGNMAENTPNYQTENQVNQENDNMESKKRDMKNFEMFSGKGSHVLPKKWLLLNHFRAMIVKRFHYITRNWKGLFSQIILPALFVSIAMTVALSAPKDEDLPALELSPSQYFNLTQPKGNYIPYSNEHLSDRAVHYLNDAGPDEIIKTFHLPSGVGATCVLKSAINGTLDADIFRNLNVSHHTLQLLSKYYEKGCEHVFVPGIRLENYVPAAAVISDKDNPYSPVTARPTDEAPAQRFYPNCECKPDKTGYECSQSGFSTPPTYRVVTRDLMQDITTKKKGNDHGDYYLFTTDAYRLHRYGAFSFGTERSFVPKNFGKNSPTLFRNLAVRGTAEAWYNNKGYHSMPVFLNTLNNAILRANLPASKGHPAAYGITVINHPMNQTNNILNMDYILQGADVLIAIFIIVAMSFVPASFVVFLVYERSNKAKHLQFVSGLNPIMYWLGNYVWDMCNYMIPALCIVVILLAFQIPAYVSSTNLPAVISLFLLYGWSMTPLMYPASFFFGEPSTAYIFLIVINLFTGITCIVASFLLEIFSYDKDLERVHNILKDVFLIFPNYCLGRGLMDIAFNQYKNEFYYKTGQYDKMHSPFELQVITRKIAVMAAMGFVFFIITLLCEYRFFIKTRRHKNYVQTSVADEDVDVAAERKRVLRGSGKKDLLRLENLTKVYKTRKLGHQLAVDRLCIGVPEGECFGLLGVNGAGKTTTFKMLTGDLRPTSGDAFLNRYSIQKDMLHVQQMIGYCPQFDALFDELTAREHIQLYSRLRGVPPAEEKQVVEWALEKLGLKQYETKPAGTYSGGNKRKLSTAIALIGHPPLIYMDEPTTGMDPHSRRFLWDLILHLIHDGRSVILTSHSMEECEVLCTRLAIMVNGRFKCLGSIQHLKNKYGDGYTMNLRLKGPDFERAQHQAQRFVRETFPEALIKECHYNLLQFELKCQNISLSYAFSKLEDAQKDLAIEDYSVSQNTLDNVFINFVKQQVEIQEESNETPSASVPQPSRTRASSRVSSSRTSTATDDLPDDNLLTDLGADLHLETDDDDEPLLNFDGTGTHLTLLNMDPVNV